MSPITRETQPFRWDGVPLLAYTEDTASHFRSVSRQVLFGDPAGLGSELRYFEVAPDGHTTLERHAHVHAVMVVRGRGACLVGDHVHEIAAHDLVFVPPETWHQFRAGSDEPLGFLCLVRCDRDRPRRPTTEELASLRADPTVGAFIRA